MTFGNTGVCGGVTQFGKSDGLICHWSWVQIPSPLPPVLYLTLMYSVSYLSASLITPREIFIGSAT